MIKVYNRLKEDFSSHPNNYPIFRGGSILGNPFTHKELKDTLAIYQVRTKEEAILRYSTYFDFKYKNDKSFKELIDEIYEKYTKGEDIYLECYCDNENECHGGIIKKKLQARLLKNIVKKCKEK